MRRTIVRKKAVKRMRSAMVTSEMVAVRASVSLRGVVLGREDVRRGVAVGRVCVLVRGCVLMRCMCIA